MQQAHHHQHIRKRIYKKFEKYPSEFFAKRMLDKLIFVVGIVSPLMTIPQIYTVFALKSAGGLSVSTWTAYTLFSVVWLAYGIVHNEKAITVNSGLWVVMNGIVAYGAYLYAL